MTRPHATQVCYNEGCDQKPTFIQKPYCSEHCRNQDAARRGDQRRDCVQCGTTILGYDIFALFCGADCRAAWNTAHPTSEEEAQRVVRLARTKSVGVLSRDRRR